MRAYSCLLLDLFRTAKLRVVFLFLGTTWVGLVLASGDPWSDHAAATLAGTGLAVAGAGSLNQYLDRDRDRLMARTSRRPLPDGRLPAWAVLAFGAAACAGGIAVLGVSVGPACGMLAAAGALYYLLGYTVLLKPRSSRSAVSGGPAGVFPPLIGWVAGGGSFSLVAVSLCALVFLWSPPHFWALTLARGTEYEDADIPTPERSRGASHVALLVLMYVVAAVAVSLLPAAFGEFGGMYLLVSAGAGLVFGALAFRLWQAPAPARAWLLHKASGVYLAVVLATMVLDRLDW
ncbi:MAG: heme o synthase [Thermoleophilia bacterium]